MRIAIAQINTEIGDFENNAKKILEFSKRASDMKAQLVVFPEASIFGYHPFDLLEKKELIKQQMKTLKLVAKKSPKEISLLVGFFEPNLTPLGRPYFNSVALIENNKVKRIFRKELLPTGDVFDEARFIEKGELKNNFFSLNGKKFFLTICEDIWAWPDSKGKSLYKKNPLKSIKSKVDLIINMSASPYFPEKMKLRDYVTQKTAKHFQSPMMYVNLVGAQDEIIFDGRSFVIDKNGKKIFQCLAFKEDLNVFDLKTLKPWSPSKQIGQTEALRQALVLGISDFCKKINFSQVHLGLSGGVDSALVACLAADALGPKNVKLFALPGPYNSSESLVSARQLAKNLGAEFETYSISKIYESCRKDFESFFKSDEFSLMHENLQSRLRGLFLMAYSNKVKSLLLTTGNKSEYATGYATLYGDMCGGLAPIGDLTKEQVFEIAKLYNAQSEIIPQFILDRPPSAELRPNQKDEDSLPPYKLLDKAVVNIVENYKSAATKTELWLQDRLNQTEFKRWQAPPILKVSAHSFGRGRRYPIACKISS